MPFYFLAVRPWVNDIKRVACIELAGPKHGKSKLMDLSDVKSVNDLMTKKAIPIRNITFKHVKDVEEHEITGGTISVKQRFVGELPAHKDETLGETLARVKRIKKEALEKKKFANQKIRRRSSGVSGKPPYNRYKQDSVPDLPPSTSGTIKPLDDLEKASMDTVTLAQLALEQVRHRSLPPPPTPSPICGQSEPQEEVTGERKEDDLDASSHSHVEVHHVVADTDGEDETETDFDEIGADFDEEDFSEFSAEEELELPAIMAEKFETSISSSIDKLEPSRGPEVKDKFRHAFSANTTEETTEESSLHGDNPNPKKLPVLKSCMKVKTLHESLRTSRPDWLRNSFDSPPSRPPRIPIRDSSRQRRAQSMYEAPPARLSPEPILDAVPALPRRRTSFTDNESCCSSYDGLVPSLGQQQPVLELQWGQVQVREYNICLGDNPACSEGPPIQLSWRYQTLPPVWLETYELGKRRHGRVRRLRGEFRKQILFHFGYDEDQQKKAIKKKEKDQKMRIKTVHRLKYMKFDQQVEKMFRVFPAVA